LLAAGSRHYGLDDVISFVVTYETDMSVGKARQKSAVPQFAQSTLRIGWIEMPIIRFRPLNRLIRICFDNEHGL
jgi:hypothetical protein